ncbi:hypothetical protein GCM10007079_01810 [Nocardiopsis terrae]|uniref:Uncharacterized protein n=1 Tax=Nocardiopsis terrae TaxID=372655 RepID=A0ABR9HMI6_9ACTN|nr:hypothetical protein [Nocardiopsis terrae]MBE1460233.1 hypothetical protein [Nocardiopsis terrae]GHC70401.1 hypothetical protein GCM10007079_01810 [Nocardiopsis terrae]
MSNPIPRPRRSDDFRPLPRRHPLQGPACPVCDHPSCRQRRAQNLPRLGGHRSEYAREHAQAAQLQTHHRHLVIWWGEATQSFWAATPTGMIEAPDVDTLLLTVWTYTAPPAPPAARPRGRSTGRVLAAA